MQKLQLSALVTRYAPTPSGYLHIGNVYSFLLTWLLARKNAGQILLRIDDLDRERVRPEYVENIFRVLEWLGMDWDLGPKSADEFQRQYSQEHRMELYRQMLEKLEAQRLVFACDCSRKKLKEIGAGSVYPGTCKKRNLDLAAENVAWRLNTEDPLKLKYQEFGQDTVETTLPASQQYFVVKRRDDIPPYHLASLADDLHFGVNFIVRGHDLYDSTLDQLYLAEKVQAQAFLRSTFFHHPLILDHNVKLSKSQKASPVLDEFYPDKARLFRKLGAWLGLAPDQAGSLEEIARHFSPGLIRDLALPLFNICGIVFTLGWL